MNFLKMTDQYFKKQRAELEKGCGKGFHYIIRYEGDYKCRKDSLCPECKAKLSQLALDESNCISKEKIENVLLELLKVYPDEEVENVAKKVAVFNAIKEELSISDTNEVEQ